ncbi:hypothetical protein K8R66_02580 [bacterium]|nr:hypothetical protein [bacterium]
MYDFLEKRKEDKFGVQADNTIDMIVGFVFEKLPYLSLLLAFLYLVYNILRPAIVITNINSF